MPPNEQALARALALLQEVELQSFTATPSTIRPFASSTLEWRVKAPTGVRLELDGKPVPRDGSQVVRPALTRTFALVAKAPPLSAPVGQQTVVVDLDACALVSLPEAVVQDTLGGVIDTLLAQDPQLSLRSPPVVDVTPAGIVMQLRFEVEVPDFRNPDFDVDALIGLAVDGDGIRPFFLKFSADLHLSFWEEVLAVAIDATLGTLAGGPFIHLALADGEAAAQADARSDILAGVRAALDAFVGALIPPGWSPHQVFLRDDAVEVRICPRPGATVVDSFRHPGFQLSATPAGVYGAPSTSRSKRRTAKRRTGSGASKRPARRAPRRGRR